MSTKLNNLKWQTVALEGFPVSVTESLQGFVGLEECTDYGFDKGSKKLIKKKQKKKRKASDVQSETTPNKRIKLTNGFIVEACTPIIPSTTNSMTKIIDQKVITNKTETKSKKNKKGKKEKDKNKVIDGYTTLSTVKLLNDNITTNYNKNDQNINNVTKSISSNKHKLKCKEAKVKVKLGEDIQQVVSELTPEDMLTWAEFKLQEPIMKALTELGFKKPTKIQQLSLPAAIHGRRDILGAAETGSGKTLAFGLPILSGILKLKEKAAAKGLDVYDIPYKKTSAKKKSIATDNIKSNKNKKEKKEKKQQKGKIVNDRIVKESSEDGYSSGDESNIDEDDDKSNDDIEIKKDKDDEEYLEEIVVPIRKRSNSVDEGNNSDDSDDYIHLSDMLDDDDLADSSDDESTKKTNDTSDNEQSEDVNDNSDNDEKETTDDEGDETVGLGEGDEEEEIEDEEGSEEDVDKNEQGIGCVRVVDNIELPVPSSIKTGKPLYALILTPTRELAIQISRHLIAAAKYTGIRIATIVGGMAAVKQERVLRRGPEVVVATPGRLWELINQGHPHLQQLDSVKFLAIDETDRMIERGHFEELYPLLERLNADDDKRSARQNFVFSATLTLVHDLPSHMKGKKVTKHGKIINRKIEKMTPQQKVNRLIKMIGMTDPKVVDITTQNLGTAETLTESRITCSLEHKDAYLYYIVKQHPGRTIVFCNSIGSVKRLAQLLTILKCKPLPLHASMPQRQRLKNLERFRDDYHGLLIATDVAARGLDIPQVDHVVHYQVPRTAENYVHRSGRTARASQEGLAVLMMEPAEAHLYYKLCHTLNKTSELPTFPVHAHILAPIKELIVVAREVDALELKKRRAAQSQGWRDKAAREMDMILDDDDVPVKKVDPSLEKALRAKKKQLEAMLSKPLYPKGFSFKYPTLNDPMALNVPEEKALQVMKKAIESGELKKEKRKSKNAPLLTLQKNFKKIKSTTFKKRKNTKGK
ncbi:hypothetical protein K1T71_012870 [Dendrolimus kikuchii]|uniref:Uncharacterized protein n=1 Tax=Dendrolimus kikuchii TaxID=765133 RepID=A0ACC1CIA3_9NEOP|nr:hypothetical protein K1T71_012870 [Dendrolimus kikuchii]